MLRVTLYFSSLIILLTACSGNDVQDSSASKIPSPVESKAEQCSVESPHNTLSYEGSCLNGKANGFGFYRATPNGVSKVSGTNRYVEGYEYDGQFKDGYFEGKGRYSADILNEVSGFYYEGSFKKGKPHGKGAYYREYTNKYLIPSTDGLSFSEVLARTLVKEQAVREPAEAKERAETLEQAEAKERAETLERAEAKERAETLERAEAKERAETLERAEAKERAETLERAEAKERAETLERAEAKERAETLERAGAKERAENKERISRKKDRKEITAQVPKHVNVCIAQKYIQQTKELTDVEYFLRLDRAKTSRDVSLAAILAFREVYGPGKKGTQRFDNICHGLDSSRSGIYALIKTEREGKEGRKLITYGFGHGKTQNAAEENAVKHLNSRAGSQLAKLKGEKSNGYVVVESGSWAR